MKEIKGALTLRNPYHAKALLTPKVQFALTGVSAPYPALARHTLSALAWLEEVGFSTVQMHMYMHMHGTLTSL